MVNRVAWKDLYSRYTTGVKFAFYGEEKESVPSLVVLTGNVKDIGAIGDSVKRGVIIQKNRVIVENGEIMCKLTVLERGGTSEYLVAEEKVASINNYTYITYYDKLLLSESDIRILTQVNLSEHFNNWSLSNGYVDKYDGIRVYLDNGSAIFKNPTVSLTLAIDENNKQRFYSAGTSDIQKGDRIYYIKENSGIILLIVVKH